MSKGGKWLYAGATFLISQNLQKTAIKLSHNYTIL